MMAARRRTREKDIIRDLAVLLRENGEKILQGKSRLSLTTICLKVLHDGFSIIAGQDDFTSSFEVLPPNSPQMNYHDLQFLYDFIQKTKSLKVIHGSSTLQGGVNISSFRTLETLELKRTPLHLLEGIAKARPRLKSLICTRCLTSLQELLESCGGDKSAAMSWPDLLSACFSYNALENLDNSLKLLPSLELLDLSHNNLWETNTHLQYLTDLKMLNLGYNRLESVPVFSFSGRALLHTLILRNNNLDSLLGLEDLTGLHHLDLANNCLCSHQELAPLQQQPKLVKLSLEGNPLSFHHRHRVLTVGYLHSSTVLKVLLDDKLVTRSEFMQCANNTFNGDVSSSITSSPEPRRMFPRVSSHSSFTHSYESTTQDETDYMQRPVKDAQKKMRKPIKPSRRARKALISDVDSLSLGDSSPGSSLSSTPVPTDHKEIRDHMETMRNQLGADWLQTLAVQRQVANHKQDQVSISSGKIATDDDLYLNERDPQINSSGTQIRLATPDNSMTNLQIEVKNNNNDSIRILDEPQHDKAENNGKSEPEMNTSMSESDTVINWKRATSEIREIDYGPESEPFIVTLPDKDNLQLILTLTERYLLEKDLNGAVVETLDLQLLKTAHRVGDADSVYAPSGDEGEDSQCHNARTYPEMKLKFGYVRKDRQKRKYIMEDEENTQSFEELLRPFLQASELATKFKDQMQCLKCGAQFKKQDANREVRRTTVTMAMTDISGSLEKDGVEEVLLCPQCGNSMLIELDVDQITNANGNKFNTPVGSFQSASSLLPLATSSAQASPWKLGTSPKFTVGSIKSVNTDASSFKSASESPFMSPVLGMKRSSSASKMAAMESPSTSDAMKKSSSASKLATLQDSVGSNELPEILEKGATNSLSQPQPWSTSEISDQNNDKILQAIRECEHSSCDIPHTLLSEKSSRRGLVYPEVSRVSRARNDSSGSDILILSHQSSQSSDISVLTNPSQASVVVIDSDSSEQTTIHNTHDQSVDSDMNSDLTPYGSLNSKTLNSMVSSVYEKGLSGSPLDSQEGTPVIRGLEHCSDLFHRTSSATSLTLLQTSDQLLNGSALGLRGSPGNTPATFTNGSPSTVLSNGRTLTGLSEGCPAGRRDSGYSGVKYSYCNFSQVDHRLKLYFMMSLFEENEEFSLVLKCGLIQYSKGEEFQGLMVASSQKIYILRITQQDSEDHPEKWLKLVQSQPITELQYVDIGLGYQSVRLEFNSETSCFTCLLRDEDRCKHFISQFTALIQGTAFSASSKLQGINKFNPAVQASLEHQILMSSTDETIGEMDSTLLKFILCYQLTGELDKAGAQSLTPVSLIVTGTHIFLAIEDYQLPAPRILGSAVANGNDKQFCLKDQQRLIDITSLDLHEEHSCKVTIQFFDEESSEEYQWHIVMETVESLKSLVSGVRSPWEAEFNVELTVNVKPCV